jgi:hypothetical protein
VPAAHGSSLAPPPEAQRAVLDDNGVLWGMRWRIAITATASAVLVAFFAALLSGPAHAEWALASGTAKIVNASVVGSNPLQKGRRTCMTQVHVVWPAPGGANRAHFTVCDDNAASWFPPGKVIKVATTSGNANVIYGEGRGRAVLAVVAESMALLCLLLLGALAVRRWLALRAAAARWRTAPWLPGSLRLGSGPGKLQQVLISFDPGIVPWTREQYRGAQNEDTCPVVGLRIQSRGDDQLADGDQVWLIPTGRSLFRRRRSAPYAVVRMTDRKVFWGTGQPLPGSS